MCGIAGIISASSGQLDLKNELLKMTAMLLHRGPDGEGHWIDPTGRVALGHRRLTMLDLSPKGSQPMISASGRFVIVLNGEIYNYRLLKSELDGLGHRFRSTSDTEVLLEAIEEWGFAAALNKTAGMFAVALYDNQKRTLYLARDRIGEKPLYYGQSEGCFFFASELKAIKALPCFNGRIDRNVLSLFLRHNYIPAPFSIYEDVYKLEPGTFLEVKLNSNHISIEKSEYWALKDLIAQSKENVFKGSNTEVIADFNNLLRDVIQQQMIADVPVGAFLSGGIDSSLVVAVMQSLSSNKVKTFTIGFNEEDYNEADDAAEIAKFIGTDHHELYVGPEDLLNLVPQIPSYYDEPFADSSAIPSCLVAKLAGQKVKVVLTGDGGDEFFCGYNPYSFNTKIWSGIKRIPLPLRKLLTGVVNNISRSALDSIVNISGRVLQRDFKVDGEKIKKLAELLSSNSKEVLYKYLLSNWINPAAVVLNAEEPDTIFTKPGLWPDVDLSYLEWMMYIDQMHYLPGNNLVKVDRASMTYSLETRAPLIDHRVIEFAWRLPIDFKLKGSEKKWILKRLLSEYVPKEITDRPKKGFGVPIEQWLRGPLRDWASDLLSEERIKREGYFDYRPIEKRWSEHVNGERNWHYSLWGMLMFQAWLDQE